MIFENIFINVVFRFRVTAVEVKKKVADINIPGISCKKTKLKLNISNLVYGVAFQV